MDKSSDLLIHFDAADPGSNPASDIIYYFWNDFEFGERKMNETRPGDRVEGSKPAPTVCLCFFVKSSL